MSVITRIGRRRKVTQSLKPKKSIAGNKMKVGYFIFGHVANSVVLSLLNIFVQVFFFYGSKCSTSYLPSVGYTV